VAYSRLYPDIWPAETEENHEHVLIIVQQDATIYSLFISANFSTCFGWYLHSSGAHITASTVSIMPDTVDTGI
jgi:hypothetical protein